MSYEFWKFIVRESFGPKPESFIPGNKISLNWFIPPLSPNSGGHINIFRFLLGLQSRGFDNRVVVTHDACGGEELSEAELINRINRWYGPFNGRAYLRTSYLPPSDFAVATGWQTSYAVKQFTGSRHKVYFIQDYEPAFMAASADAGFAEASYRFGFTGVTAGNWLANLLSTRYGMKTYPLSFSFDRSLYKRTVRRDPHIKHVFAYVRPETPRRGWELVMLSLALFSKLRPDVRFILAGGNINSSELPFSVLAPGALRQEELADLYSQVDCALIISLTNLSLLPLELMACGIPVVSNRGPNTEWLLNDDIAFLADPTPEALANRILDVMDLSNEEWTSLSRKVTAFAESTNWDAEIDKLEHIIKDLNASELPAPKPTSKLDLSNEPHRVFRRVFS